MQGFGTLDTGLRVVFSALTGSIMLRVACFGVIMMLASMESEMHLALLHQACRAQQYILLHRLVAAVE
jgi:hypothetical protein